MAKKLRSIFFGHWVIAVTPFILGYVALKWGAPWYFNEFQSIGSGGYADVRKMVSDHPGNIALRELIEESFTDHKITSSEFQLILYFYVDHHGTFFAHPIEHWEEMTIRESKLKLLDIIS